MQVVRTNSDAFVVNRLPDGSQVLLDPASEQVYALNATAGAAWDACRKPATLAEVTEDMQRSFDPALTNELAEEAILQLRDKSLVTTSGSSPQATRRQFITTLGAMAAPLVVSLTLADQRAYAGATTSRPTTHPPTVPLP
jgi:hypothetical protein